MLRLILVWLTITTFTCTANASKTPIKLRSSAAFNQQAPTISPYTPSSSNCNCNCPSMSEQTPMNSNVATPASQQPYVPYYYTPSANAPSTPPMAVKNNPSIAATPSGNSSILLNAPSTDKQKTNQSWTIT